MTPTRHDLRKEKSLLIFTLFFSFFPLQILATTFSISLSEINSTQNVHTDTHTLSLTHSKYHPTHQIVYCYYYYRNRKEKNISEYEESWVDRRMSSFVISTCIILKLEEEEEKEKEQQLIKRKKKKNLSSLGL